jgi:Kef-type K+ transport system membrane component KefB
MSPNQLSALFFFQAFFILVVLLAAVAAKGAACWLAAGLNGESNRTALAVGTLMNAGGLMELIILNIGLQKGLIQPALFSIMVVMAIVTTLMASPLFELVYRTKTSRAGTEDAYAAKL